MIEQHKSDLENRWLIQAGWALMIRQKFERAESILKGVRVTDRLSEVDKRMLSNCKVVFNTIVG